MFTPCTAIQVELSNPPFMGYATFPDGSKIDFERRGTRIDWKPKGNQPWYYSLQFYYILFSLIVVPLSDLNRGGSVTVIWRPRIFSTRKRVSIELNNISTFKFDEHGRCVCYRGRSREVMVTFSILGNSQFNPPPDVELKTSENIEKIRDSLKTSIACLKCFLSCDEVVGEVKYFELVHQTMLSGPIDPFSRRCCR